MKLHFKTFGEGKPLVILHGLFGSLDNWQTHAKNFAKYFKVYIVDQRNHGHSPHSDEFSYDLMVEDFHEFVQDQGLEDFVLIGHSMGGKTAMAYAEKYGDTLDKLVIVDIGPKQYPMHHEQILAGLTSMDFTKITSRKLAEKHLLEFIPEPGVRQFLLKNLYWVEKGKLAFRMNVKVLDKTIGEILKKIDISEVYTQTLFVRGAQSNYILDEDFNAIEDLFVDSDIITIENAGHWVHAEAPKEFYDEIMNFVLR
jgi:pimeloyl-ACP methyl ester carboxylesterase